MPMVRASSKVFVGNTLREEGEVFQYDGPPSRHLIPQEPEPVQSSSPSSSVSSPPKPKVVADPTKPWRKINGES